MYPPLEDAPFPALDFILLESLPKVMGTKDIIIRRKLLILIAKWQEGFTYPALPQWSSSLFQAKLQMHFLSRNIIIYTVWVPMMILEKKLYYMV